MAKLLEKSLLGADFARQSFRATPAAGTTIEEMLDPAYWAHVASKFNPHDLIEVVPEDGSFYARLFVVNVGKLFVKVSKLEYVTFDSTAKGEDKDILSQFESKWGGPNAKWRIHRKSDNATVSNETFQNREDADNWLALNVKNLAA